MLDGCLCAASLDSGDLGAAAPAALGCRGAPTKRPPLKLVPAECSGSGHGRTIKKSPVYVPTASAHVKPNPGDCQIPNPRYGDPRADLFRTKPPSAVCVHLSGAGVPLYSSRRFPCAQLAGPLSVWAGFCAFYYLCTMYYYVIACAVDV
ncbi:unnamed protein product, partial [Iphiclides podalirius]